MNKLSAHGDETNKSATAIAAIALQIGAIRLQPQQPFTWASGYRMPIYNDNRLLLSTQQCRDVVVDGFVKKVYESYGTGLVDLEVIAGTATAGIPWATLLADRLKLPLVYVRDRAKSHGKQRRVEGVLKEGQKTLVIEDLISTGGSSVSALNGLRDEGAICDVCLAIFSYGFSEADTTFQSVGASYTALLTFDQLLTVAIQQKKISEEQVSLLNDWRMDPFGWGEKNGFPKVVQS